MSLTYQYSSHPNEYEFSFSLYLRNRVTIGSLRGLVVLPGFDSYETINRHISDKIAGAWATSRVIVQRHDSTKKFAKHGSTCDKTREES